MPASIPGNQTPVALMADSEIPIHTRYVHKSYQSDQETSAGEYPR